MSYDASSLLSLFLALNSKKTCMGMATKFKSLRVRAEVGNEAYLTTNKINRRCQLYAWLHVQFPRACTAACVQILGQLIEPHNALSPNKGSFVHHLTYVRVKSISKLYIPTSELQLSRDTHACPCSSRSTTNYHWNLDKTWTYVIV